MISPKKKAEEIIQDGYSRIQEGDDLISITEQGLKAAIETALRETIRECYEDAVMLAHDHEFSEKCTRRKEGHCPCDLIIQETLETRMKEVLGE